MLRASTRLKQLVLQRTDSTQLTEHAFEEMLDQLKGTSPAEIRGYITVRCRCGLFPDVCVCA